MIESANPEIDVDALMEEIRAEVLRARAAGVTGSAHSTGLPVPGVDPTPWYGILDQLHVAEQHAAVGLEVPPFVRYGGIKRALARAVAKVVLFLSQVATQPQRTTNVASLTALRLLVERVQTLEGELAALRARLGSPGGSSDRRS